MDDSDLQLVSDCRQGDQLAWEKLVRRYQRLIYAIPRRAGLSEDQAAEIFQDVFTTLFEKLDDIEDPERLQAWLVTTTRRCCGTSRHYPTNSYWFSKSSTGSAPQWRS
jgi:RNA polymerase sigma factor (sigma-70 family)